ncbi:YybH family protein [Spirosoma endophyticum]|uniref:Ketosteroid isomerase homolog n=1 Tax=Spirosoma endophyticum TaxID=662367 RepID=A0A1I1KZS4_9BACT|nr:nuclear transport factor 2 family protein [Spirosoma endophyticum]SFC63663.1 Ketosteroid isomerase homolog [Spirosoma endophyticum]
MSNQEQIEQLIRGQEQAVQQKNIDGAMAHYATDVVSFDVVDTLQKEGILACRERLESWLSQFPETFSYAIEKLSVVANDELGFGYSFNHVKGLLANGDEIDMRWRSTVCLRKQSGQWLITHEHSSVPFDAQSGQALIKLEA